MNKDFIDTLKAKRSYIGIVEQARTNQLNNLREELFKMQNICDHLNPDGTTAMGFVNCTICGAFNGKRIIS